MASYEERRAQLVAFIREEMPRHIAAGCMIPRRDDYENMVVILDFRDGGARCYKEGTNISVVPLERSPDMPRVRREIERERGMDVTRTLVVFAVWTELKPRPESCVWAFCPADVTVAHKGKFKAPLAPSEQKATGAAGDTETAVVVAKPSLRDISPKAYGPGAQIWKDWEAMTPKQFDEALSKVTAQLGHYGAGDMRTFAVHKTPIDDSAAWMQLRRLNDVFRFCPAVPPPIGGGAGGAGGAGATIGDQMWQSLCGGVRIPVEPQRDDETQAEFARRVATTAAKRTRVAFFLFERGRRLADMPRQATEAMAFATRALADTALDEGGKDAFGAAGRIKEVLAEWNQRPGDRELAEMTYQMAETGMVSAVCLATHDAKTLWIQFAFGIPSTLAAHPKAKEIQAAKEAKEVKETKAAKEAKEAEEAKEGKGEQDKKDKHRCPEDDAEDKLLLHAPEMLLVAEKYAVEHGCARIAVLTPAISNLPHDSAFARHWREWYTTVFKTLNYTIPVSTDERPVPRWLFASRVVESMRLSGSAKQDASGAASATSATSAAGAGGMSDKA